MNRQCEKLKLMSRCLIFVQGLIAPKDAEIKSHLLSKLEEDSKLTLKTITEECQSIINLRQYTTKIEEIDISHIRSVNKMNTVKKKVFLLKLILGYLCGQIHLYKNCPFKNKKKYYDCVNNQYEFSHCRKEPRKKNTK